MIKIWNKKVADLTVGETVKASFWLTLIGVLVGVAPFAIATVLENRDVPEEEETPRIETEDENEE